MSYPHENDIRRWLENWVRWSPGSFGKSQWAGSVASSNVFAGAPVPIMSGSAADTQDALKRMDRTESRLLTQYHLGRGGPSVMAKRRKISLDTLERQLHDAHHHFWDLRQTLREAYQAAGESNAKTSKESTQRRRTTAYEDIGRRLQKNRTKPTDGGAR